MVCAECQPPDRARARLRTVRLCGVPGFPVCRPQRVAPSVLAHLEQRVDTAHGPVVVSLARQMGEVPKLQLAGCHQNAGPVRAAVPSAPMVG